MWDQFHPTETDAVVEGIYVTVCRNCQSFRDIYKLSHRPLGPAECEHFGEVEIVRRVWGAVAISVLRHRDTHSRGKEADVDVTESTGTLH